MTKIAVVGGGRIGEALISGLVAAGHRAADISVVEKVAARSAELNDRYGVRPVELAEVPSTANVVFIAVKPHDVQPTIAALTDVGAVELVVSLAAGIGAARIEDGLPPETPVVRVMPNTPMLVGKGMSVLSAGKYATSAHLALVEELLSAVGAVAIVDESQMDAVTAVSGSGPAYFFLVVEAMVEAGVSLGLPHPVAHQLVVQTLVGSAEMVRTATDTVPQLRAAVTSPGGTTAAAIRRLESAGLRSAFFEALAAARDRAVELG